MEALYRFREVHHCCVYFSPNRFVEVVKVFTNNLSLDSHSMLYVCISDYLKRFTFSMNRSFLKHCPNTEHVMVSPG